MQEVVLKTRHSVVSVSYYNMDSQEVDFEVVEDATIKAKIGTVVKQVKRLRVLPVIKPED